MFLVFLFVFGTAIDIFAVLFFFLRNPNHSSARRNMLSRPWSWPDIGIFICVLSLTQMLSGLLCRMISGPGSIFNPRDIFIQTTTLPLCTLILVYELYIRRGYTLGDIFGIRFSSVFQDIGRGFLTYAGIFPFFVIAAILYGAALKSIEYPIIHQDVILWFVDRDIPLWFKWHLVIMAVAIAPLTEEILFRGILLPAVMKNCRTPLAVAFVSLLFAAAHFHFSAALPLFILALGLSLAYIYSGSLMVPIVIHSIFNGVMLLSATCMRDAVFQVNTSLG